MPIYKDIRSQTKGNDKRLKVIKFNYEEVKAFYNKSIKIVLNEGLEY